MRFFTTLTILPVSLLLASCATSFDSQMQDVSVTTPGSAQSKCYLDNGVRHPIVLGQTIKIQRSRKDMVVECYGLGNRYKKIVVPSVLNDWTYANAANAVVPGVAYDAFGGGMWEYPAVITVDFTGVPTQGFETPDYHNKDAPNPYEQPIESYAPGVPRIESDSGIKKRVIEKRDGNIDNNPFSFMNPTPAAPAATGAPTPLPNGAATPAAKTVPKGGSAEELTRSMNPSVFNR